MVAHADELEKSFTQLQNYLGQACQITIFMVQLRL